MTKESDRISLVRHVVLVFDICSSTSILENLKQTDSLDAWRILIIGLKEFLLKSSEELGFEIYKFIGDGWILLFPENIRGLDLMHFLGTLFAEYDMNFDSVVKPHLERVPQCLGLTFGADKGELVRFVMNGNTEYVGRPLNVASRLQSATKQGEPNYATTALFSKPCYSSLRLPDGRAQPKLVKRRLPNILGGEDYECVQIRIGPWCIAEDR